MGGLVVDAIEQILVRLDVEDLIRFKSVCKSWYCSISSPPFVKAHLKYSDNKDRNDPELEHRRISSYEISNEDSWLFQNFFHIVGSCNGLVCISPRDDDFVVTNPCTRELKNIKTPPFRPNYMQKLVNIRQIVCWGFGYDPAADDYKVVAGYRKSLDENRVIFHVLTLKSNTWKVIGEVNYSSTNGKTGILCGGTLYWFMLDKNFKHVIISLDLSTEEFKQVPKPDPLFEFSVSHRLGLIDESLCIYHANCSSYYDKWVMTNNNMWELYENHHRKNKYVADVAHFLTVENHVVGSRSYVCWGLDDGERVYSAGNYIRASIFVKSLVSPHPYRHPHVVINNNNNNNYYEEQTRIPNALPRSLAPSLLIQFQTRFLYTLELEGKKLTRVLKAAPA